MSMPRRNPQHLSPVIMATLAEANRWEVACVCAVDYVIIAWNLVLFWQVVISIIIYFMLLIVAVRSCTRNSIGTNSKVLKLVLCLRVRHE
jgi:hypothetical protein